MTTLNQFIKEFIESSAGLVNLNIGGPDYQVHQQLASFYEAEQMRLVREFEKRSGPGTPRIKSVEPAKDIDEFGLVLAELIGLAQDKIFPRKVRDKVEFRSANSNLEFKNDVITWSLISRLPGQASQGSMNGEVKHRHLVARPRGTYDSEEYPNHKVGMYGASYDNTVELTCFSLDKDRCLELALWIESLIMSFRWYFCYRGFNRVFFCGNKGVCFEEIGANRFYSSKLEFYVSTEKITQIVAPELTSIALQVMVKNATTNFTDGFFFPGVK